LLNGIAKLVRKFCVGLENNRRLADMLGGKIVIFLSVAMA
jgi:hypothetical protein